MRVRLRFSLATLAILAVSGSLWAQMPEPIPVPTQKLPPPPPRTQVAVTVNGKGIPEISVYRALTRIPPDKWTQVRSEVVNFLIENSLVDQYLEQLKIPVEEKEIEKRLDEIKDEIKKQKQEYAKFLEKMFLTEGELREQIVGTVRWDKFMDKYGSDAVLKDLFEKNKNWFDGTLVRAKHVLVKPKENTPKGAEEAKAKVEAYKKQIDTALAARLAQLPAGTDKLTLEKERQKALDEIFSEVAKEGSDCPSKAQGGELGYFPRLGKMVEPFAFAAFALKPYEVSNPVGTEFGYHIILSTEVKAGKNVTFEEVKLFVQEVHAERLREAILTKMRPISKIEVQKAGN